VALAFVAELKNRPWLLAVVVSWGIAFIEYLFQVPANRIGSATMSKAQLKIVQEVIALCVFAMLAIFYWKEKVTWNFLWAGLCIMAAVFFIFRDGNEGPETATAPLAVDAIALPMLAAVSATFSAAFDNVAVTPFPLLM